jgi:hypothetical protein|tara:strand:+ start:58 stop:582 length:525 start_codon:yes stop_codon:yes gene_type:complete
MVIEKINEKGNKRICVWCGAESPTMYCNEDCQRQQVYDNNKNPLSTYGSGIHAKDLEELGLDEVHIPDEVSILIDNQEHRPRIQEDIGYLFSCLEDLPVATYSDGTKLHNTRQYKENRKNGITVSLNVQNRPRHKFRPPNTDQDYETLEERLAKARKHEQPYIVWNYKTDEDEL